MADIIESLEEVLEDLEGSRSKALQGLYDEIFDFVYSLKRDSIGRVKPTIANLQAINKFKFRIKNNKAYKAFIRDYEEGVDVIDEISTDYLKEVLSSDILENRKFADELKRQTIAATVEQLDSMMTNSVATILRNGVVNNLPFKDIVNSIKENTVENIYAFQEVRDSLNTYTRNHINTMSAGLAREYFIYSGVKVERTRCFCQKRIGRVFTYDEIVSWVDEEWEGKKEGTNAETIFSYVGGYNCDHTFIPISKKIYDKGKKGLNPNPCK